ncbi:MAG TPA: calcium-binding protein [Polyangiaceae bacterium]|jgi:Ca2+-binding RTX toxin-like protein|nr:calcium-binding protein [Polyangiaceae bacterium]
MPNTTLNKQIKTRTLRASLGTLLLAFAAGCSSGAGQTSAPSPQAPVSVDPIEAILGQKLTAPVHQCTFVASTGMMTVNVAAETAIISKRATDSNIVQNGYDCDVPVNSAKLKGIVITGSTGNETVILDYTNGLFATGTASTVGIANVDMGGSAGADSFGIRGTSTADTVTFGADGVAVNSDKFKDITFKSGGEPDTYAVSLAAGDDKWSASGGAAVGLAGAYAGGKPISIYGGAGKDTFDEGTLSTPKESLHGGDDSDTLTYATRGATHPVKITMGSGTTDDGEYDFTGSATIESDDVDVDIENVIGTPGNDDIADTAGTAAVNLTGGAGNDKLAGGTGDDTLNGGDGDDTFNEGTSANGADTFNGGAGIDTVDYSARTLGVTVTMDGTKANDGDTAGNEKDNVKADVENCYGSKAADTITGNSSNNTLKGGLGADTLNGGDGDDTFVEGGTSSDRLASDVDNDTFVCGKGTDTVTYAGRTNALTLSIDGHADSGDPALDPGADGGVAAMVDGGVIPGESDTIGLDCENLTGGSGVNTMTGSAGPNELVGGAAADHINGGDGDDVIDGAGGADVVNGGPGGGDICFGSVGGTKTACEL